MSGSKFVQLDRNNAELSARPVLVDLRKMVEDQARIIVTKGAVHPQVSVDIIVSFADNVPQSMYLDETYIFRVSVTSRGISIIVLRES